jgi:hypothetical protein
VSSLTASQAVFTDASKGLVSNAVTGTGNVVMSASPTLTGTIGAAAMTLSSTLGVTGQLSANGSLVASTGSAASGSVFVDNVADDKPAIAFRRGGTVRSYLRLNTDNDFRFLASDLTTAASLTVGAFTASGATTLSSTLAVSSAAAATVTDYIATFTNTNGTGNSGSGVIKVKMSAGGTSDYVGIGLHNSGDTRIGSILQNGSSGNLTIGVGSANNTRLTFDYGTGLATFANAVTVSGATTLSAYGSGGGLVSVGAVDSGGTGYRLLRVPN